MRAFLRSGSIPSTSFPLRRCLRKAFGVGGRRARVGGRGGGGFPHKIGVLLIIVNDSKAFATRGRWNIEVGLTVLTRKRRFIKQDRRSGRGEERSRFEFPWSCLTVTAKCREMSRWRVPYFPGKPVLRAKVQGAKKGTVRRYHNVEKRKTFKSGARADSGMI